MRVIVVVTGADLKTLYYPQREELERREKDKVSTELGIEFIEVEE